MYKKIIYETVRTNIVTLKFKAPLFLITIVRGVSSSKKKSSLFKEWCLTSRGFPVNRGSFWVFGGPLRFRATVLILEQVGEGFESQLFRWQSQQTL